MPPPSDMLCGTHMHNGPNNSGNKSMLAFRSDIGIPGYTGFCASPQQVPLPTKLYDHTGRPVSQDVKDAATLNTVAHKPASPEYSSRYHKQPGDTSACSKTGGGYWVTQRTSPHSQPFTARTTYQAEVLDGERTAQEQLERSVGLACTLPQYEAARATAPRVLSADRSLRHSGQFPATSSSFTLGSTQRPATCTTSRGELVGYQTSQGALFVAQPLVGGSASPGRAAQARLQQTSSGEVPASNVEMRYKVMPHAMPPTMFGAAYAYHADFGPDCTDPMKRSAPGERFQSRLATTSPELAAGTARVTNNPPGYVGHIPASKFNKLAQAQADAPDERQDQKIDMLLFNFDQYSRTRLPGYTGHKPQAARNITSTQPAQGPTTITTLGAANYTATKTGLPLMDRTHHNNSKAGIMTFFDTSGTSVSDNGLANSQSYFKINHPEAAKLKFEHPIRNTHYGSKFVARNSLV
ncbi:flagellar associated protein [Haematococcus lacustris]